MASLPCRGDTNDINAGFLYDEFPLTLLPGHRTEILGPLFYSQESLSEKIWAVPPLLSVERDSATKSVEIDSIYPVFTYARYGTEYRWQLGQLLSHSGGMDPGNNTRDRFTLFPIYFQQRGTDPSENYTAVFPFYGHIYHRLFRDEILAVMFPLFSETRKADVITDNYLYPFFDVRHGDGLHGWQAWPLIGREHKDVTTQTNGFGDVQIVAGHENFFFLWPFYFNEHTGIGTDNPAVEHTLIPLYSLYRSPNRDQTTVIWPLFSHVTDRAQNYREWQTPWPLIIFARGEGKTANRVWPFYSHAVTTNAESDFFLWPLYKYNRFHVGTYDRSRKRVLFFLYSDVNIQNLETGQKSRRFDFWPLFARRRDFEGNTHLEILAPLEPILPYNVRVDRDYSQLWALWRSDHNVKTGAASQSLLWNLYRHETTPVSKKCSLLFGLFQYESNPEGKHVRLFYIPIGKSKAPPKRNLQ
jgi:hypothetical protein